MPLTVRETSQLIGKSEETIKRWIRDGKLKATKKSDKAGWVIQEEDIKNLSVREKKESNKSVPPLQSNLQQETNQYHRELANLAYQAVTMTSPTEEIIRLLSHIGIKRSLEILLTMQQSPTKVKNPPAFIKKAITNGWTPSTLPIKKDKNVARVQKTTTKDTELVKVPFYNWLED